MAGIWAVLRFATDNGAYRSPRRREKKTGGGKVVTSVSNIPICMLKCFRPDNAILSVSESVFRWNLSLNGYLNLSPRINIPRTAYVVLLSMHLDLRPPSFTAPEIVSSKYPGCRPS